MFGDQGLSVGEFCSQRAQATVVHECGIPQLFIAGDLLSGSGESPGLFPAQLFYGCLLCLTLTLLAFLIGKCFLLLHGPPLMPVDEWLRNTSTEC